MRARMALLVSGIACEVREVRLRAKPAAMIALSPKGTVPVLLLPDGQVIDQSIDIMHWALALNDPEDWLASAGDPLIATNDGAFKFHLDRYKYPDRHQSDPIAHRAAAVDMLHALDTRLQVSPNLARSTRSLVDIALLPFVRQFANTDRTFFDALPLRDLQHWLAAHLAAPLFEIAMLNPPIGCEADDQPT